MTSFSAEAEVGLFFSSLPLCHSRYIKIWSVLRHKQSSQGTNKSINKIPWSLCLGVYHDDQDTRNTIHYLAVFTLSLLCCPSTMSNPFQIHKSIPKSSPHKLRYILTSKGHGHNPSKAKSKQAQCLTFSMHSPLNSKGPQQWCFSSSAVHSVCSCFTG